MNNFFLIIIFFISIIILGCSEEMNDLIVFKFKVDESVDLNDLNDLNVNLYITRRDFSSQWYTMEKKQTIIYKGKVIQDSLNEFNVFYFDFFIYRKNLKKRDNIDNIFKEYMSLIHEYQFNKDSLGFKISLNGEEFSDGAISYKELNYLNNEEFKYYDPNTAKFEIFELPHRFELLNRLTYEELLEANKILSKDIVQLKHLTQSQKNELIKVHNQKKFDIVGLE